MTVQELMEKLSTARSESIVVMDTVENSSDGDVKLVTETHYTIPKIGKKQFVTLYDRVMDHYPTLRRSCDMIDIMVDLETMGTGSSAAIVSIGAVRMDLEKFVTDPTEFYTPVQLRSSAQAMGVQSIDADTVVWWLRQNDEARKAIISDDAIHISIALQWSYEWATANNTISIDDIRIWGNGSDFDNVILMNAYKATKVIPPWRFYNNRCYRTMKNLVPHIKMVRQGDHHNALADARSQAIHLTKIFEELAKIREKAGE